MLWRTLAAATALMGLVAGQTHTDCDPLKKDCPADPAFGTDHLFHFNSTPSSDFWRTTAGVVNYDPNDGATFTINKQGDSPTIRTNFYIFYGRTEIWLRTSPGKGIISSVMLLSDDRDEIDWEFVGVKNNEATTNFYSKGKEVYTNGGVHKVAGATTDGEFHNYTCIWTEDKIDWFVDGQNVRTRAAADAKPGYPQTPMRLSLGIWAGGDPKSPQGTRDWAGGDVDYNAGPYTMHVKSVQITDFHPGSKEYLYGDRSGSSASIKVTEGNSTAFEALHKEPEKSVGEKFNALPNTAKAAIYAGGAAVGAVALGSLVFYYIRQRRIGAAEAKRAEEQAEADRREEQRLAKDGIDPDSFKEHGQELGKDNWVQVEDTSYANEKPWARDSASAAVGAVGAAGAAGAMGAARRGPQSPTSPQNGPQRPGMASPGPGSIHSTRSPASPANQPFDFGLPPPAASPGAGPMRSQSQGMPSPFGGPPSHPPSQTRSATTDGAFDRMGSPGPQQAYGAPSRMQSPGPQQQGYNMQRMQSPGPQQQGYNMQRMQSPGPQQQGYNMQRMQSPAPMRPDQAFGVQRMQSPGPQQPGYNMQRMQSPQSQQAPYQPPYMQQGTYPQNSYYGGQGGRR